MEEDHLFELNYAIALFNNEEVCFCVLNAGSPLTHRRTPLQPRRVEALNHRESIRTIQKDTTPLFQVEKAALHFAQFEKLFLRLDDGARSSDPEVGKSTA